MVELCPSHRVPHSVGVPGEFLLRDKFDPRELHAERKYWMVSSLSTQTCID